MNGRILRSGFRNATCARGPSLLLLIILSAAMACITSSPQAAETAKDESFLGVRILKTKDAGELDWSVVLPSSCPSCRLELNQFTTSQNPKDFFFHFWAPLHREPIKRVFVKVDPEKVRGVLVAQTDLQLATELSKDDKGKGRAEGAMSLPFQTAGNGIMFDIPPHLQGVSIPPGGAGDVTEMYTYLESPGMYVRVCHDDEQRRRGYYRGVPWPRVEVQAALNLEFAAREAIRHLGLIETLQSKGVDTIMLMNFDTNNPTLGPFAAHEDYEPHWHMHLWWSSNPRVRKVGHFFISPEGLLTMNIISSLQDPIDYPFVENGAAHPTKTPEGEVLYSHTITTEGYFVLSTPHDSCRFVPLARGFDSGVRLSCENGSWQLRVSVQDDVEAGILRVKLDDQLTEEHRYDPDTGTLLSSASAPALSTPKK